MANHDAWQLICRLFGGGTPVLLATLSPTERKALRNLGKAVKPAALNQDYALCSYCQQQRGPVFSDGHGGRVCHCPACGSVALDADDLAALKLDEEWLRKQLRMALSIDSRDGVDNLGGDVWRLGEARQAPVLLARDITTFLHQPDVLDRVRVPESLVRVIAPRQRHRYITRTGHDFDWLPMEERFLFYGGSITLIPNAVTRETLVDPAAPIFGPFSADFRWVTLPEWHHGLIHCSEGQAAIFKALWSFHGKPAKAEPIMQRAGLESDKPIDLFKVKSQDKGKPEAEGPLFAYRTLVMTQQHQGQYAMPCAAAVAVV